MANSVRMNCGVRRLVTAFDSFSRTLIDKAGEGVSHKLQARFGWAGGENSGVQYEVRGTFTEH
jgi:hypothetical protein